MRALLVAVAVCGCGPPDGADGLRPAAETDGWQAVPGDTAPAVAESRSQSVSCEDSWNGEATEPYASRAYNVHVTGITIDPDDPPTFVVVAKYADPYIERVALSDLNPVTSWVSFGGSLDAYGHPVVHCPWLSSCVDPDDIAWPCPGPQVGWYYDTITVSVR